MTNPLAALTPVILALFLATCGARIDPAPASDEPATCREQSEPVALDAFCPVFERRCDELCTPAIATWLEQSDEWLCPAVARALLACLEAPHCDEVVDCTVEWFDDVATP